MHLLDKAKNSVRLYSWEHADALEQYSEREQKKIKRGWGIGFVIGYTHAWFYWRWCLLSTFFNTDMALEKFEAKRRKINQED